MSDIGDFIVQLAEAAQFFKDAGYRIIEPEPEGFKRIIAGREAVRVRSEL